jgi:hypothetical protein
VQPDFNTCLLLGIELLKHGAKAVDMHPWGLRLRAPSKTLETWSVGLIPQSAQDNYARSLFGNQPPLAAVEPIDPDPNRPSDGGEVPDDESTPQVGAAP